MTIFLTALPGVIDENGFQDAHIPALAIYLLHSVLLSNGINSEIIDGSTFLNDGEESFYSTIKNELLKRVKEFDIICFSVNTFSWALTKIACKIIKENTNAKIILGGLHPSKFADYIMKTTSVDYIIKGEGEMILPQLINEISRDGDISCIAGISYRFKNKIYHNEGYGYVQQEHFNKQALPSFDRIPQNVYRAIPVEASRGCLYNCNFCSIPHRNNYRSFTVEEIERRLLHAKQHASYFGNTSVINFVDDCFTANKQKVNELLTRISKMNDGFTYFIEARVNDIIKEEIIDSLYPEIIDGIQIGIECGYDRGIKLVGKGTDLKRLFACAKKLKEKHLDSKAFYSFIIGFPWEGEEEINLTLDTIEKLSELYNISALVNWLILLPSRIWDNRNSYNITISEDVFDEPGWFFNKTVFFSTHPTVDQELFDRIEKRIIEMQINGVNIVYNSPNFDYNKLINKIIYTA